MGFGVAWQQKENEGTDLFQSFAFVIRRAPQTKALSRYREWIEKYFARVHSIDSNGLFYEFWREPLFNEIPTVAGKFVNCKGVGKTQIT